MSKLLQKLLIILISFSLTACASNDDSIESSEQIGRIDPQFLSKHSKPSDSIEEHINRVGKKILVISNNPNINYQFHSLSTADQILELDPATNTISVSHGLLKSLSDEAELAAVLTMSMAKLAYSSDIDHETINYLFRAGYDPQALINLQQSQAEYLKTIYTTLPDTEIIDKNKAAVSKLPLGLKRGAEEYSKQMENVY